MSKTNMRLTLAEIRRRAEMAMEAQPEPAYLPFVMKAGHTRLIDAEDGPDAIRVTSLPDKSRCMVAFDAAEVLRFCDEREARPEPK